MEPHPAEKIRDFMKCVVTAGPTYEELDEVRRLTNFSTGALGAGLADYLAGLGHEVELLSGYYSTCPPAARAQRRQTFTTTADLRRRLAALAAPDVEAVFHAAEAVRNVRKSSAVEDRLLHAGHEAETQVFADLSNLSQETEIENQRLVAATPEVIQ